MMNWKSIKHYLPYAIIGICILEVFTNWSRPDVAIAWIVATIGWLSYKFEL